ncbi:MAG TPA: FAD:protein FMN transferase [Acidimicrobiales bacterium]|nr:FAD:protein FMN transferase [Acidimicrobiales bacterium]
MTTAGLSGPGRPSSVVCHDEVVMGTVVSFTIHRGDVGTEDVRVALSDACALLHRADTVFSTWEPQSPMSRIRRNATPLGPRPAEIDEVLDLCRTAREASDGWFDPWAMPGGVDPTGLVKGWAIELATAAISTAGVSGVVVNGGGDVAVSGTPGHSGEPWRIGVRHPWRADALACVVSVDSSLATSGTYERGNHFVDPRSGARSFRAVTASVVGPSLAMADAFATAVMVGGDEALRTITAGGRYGVYLVRPDGSEASGGKIAFLED